MPRTQWSNHLASYWPGLLLLILLVALLINGVLPQDPSYHQFADQRNLLGIPHSLDVLSNLPFCLFGLLGVYASLTRRQQLQSGSRFYLCFFIAIFFTGLGSVYYHLGPDNSSLVWDRLPMAVGFMSIIALMIAEGVNPKLGRSLLPWLLAAGVGSVLYWHGFDDLRPYVLVQFGSLLMLPFMLLRYRYRDSGLLWLAIGFYLLAKLLEFLDLEIFLLTAEWVSGHSLKHLAAALTPAVILLRLRRLSAPHAVTTRPSTTNSE